MDSGSAEYLRFDDNVNSRRTPPLTMMLLFGRTFVLGVVCNGNALDRDGVFVVVVENRLSSETAVEGGGFRLMERTDGSVRGLVVEDRFEHCPGVTVTKLKLRFTSTKHPVVPFTMINTVIKW